MLVSTTRSLLPCSSTLLSSLSLSSRLAPSITTSQPLPSPSSSSFSPLIFKKELHTFIHPTQRTYTTLGITQQLQSSSLPLSSSALSRQIFSGWSFVITGTFEKTREELTSLIESHGGEVKTKVSGQVFLFFLSFLLLFLFP